MQLTSTMLLQKQVQEPIEKISIISLIYKSPKYAEFVKNSLEEHTPMLKTKEAEFHFVVNFKKGESEKIVEYLSNKKYPFLVFDKNPEQTEYPKNIGQIYEAWNFACQTAEGNIICLVNSDMAFSKDWLENLYKYLVLSRVVCSRLVESGKLRSGQYAIEKNFGRTPDEFKKEEFEAYAENINGDKILEGGLFMPLMIHKENFLKVKGYPEGNIGGIPGDQIFMAKLKSIGVKHYTVFDSIVYHIQTGESSEGEKSA